MSGTKEWITRLAAHERCETIPPEEDVFGRFIGRWQVRLAIHEPDGVNQAYNGEWHFSRILKGRAVQDVWIIPSMNKMTSDNDYFHEYGTSIRTYDPESSKWKVVWVGPIQHHFFVFDVCRTGEDIILEECSQTKLKMKWTFYDIAANSFQWKSEVYIRKMKGWFTNYHMSVKRM